MVSALARSRSPMSGSLMNTFRAIMCDAGLLECHCVSSWITRWNQWECVADTSLTCSVSFFCAHAAHHQTGQHQLITCLKKKKQKKKVWGATECEREPREKREAKRERETGRGQTGRAQGERAQREGESLERGQRDRARKKKPLGESKKKNGGDKKEAAGERRSKKKPSESSRKLRRRGGRRSL